MVRELGKNRNIDKSKSGKNILSVSEPTPSECERMEIDQILADAHSELRRQKYKNYELEQIVAADKEIIDHATKKIDEKNREIEVYKRKVGDKNIINKVINTVNKNTDPSQDTKFINEVKDRERKRIELLKKKFQ